MRSDAVLCLLQVSLKLGLSEWSDKFSLDTVGSIGTVQCKLKDQTMPVSCDGCILFTYVVMYLEWTLSSAHSFSVSPLHMLDACFPQDLINLYEMLI